MAPRGCASPHKVFAAGSNPCAAAPHQWEYNFPLHHFGIENDEIQRNRSRRGEAWLGSKAESDHSARAGA